MASRINVNEDVNVTAWYFRNNRRMSSYPRRIEWGGRSIAFSDGMRLSVSKSGVSMHIFDMLDASGGRSYRLQCRDADFASWKLVAITEHA